MKYPNLNEEKKLWKREYKYVAGLDEAGRGPLAGPVVAAAVMVKISNFQFLIQKQFQNFKFKKLFKNLKFKIKNLQLRDSKKLSLKQREEFYRLITRSSIIEWGLGKVSEKVIDKINILEATKLAMEKAIKNLEKKLKRNQNNIFSNGRWKRCYSKEIINFFILDFLILDGKLKLNLPIAQKSIVKADEKVFSCAAASIIAKVTRDDIMKKYHQKYPQYGFARHKGYPTKEHIQMLKKYGRCAIHRKSFHYAQ